MDASTRPSATRRQKLQLNKRALAAFLIILIPSIVPVLAAQNASMPLEAAPDTVASIAKSATQAIAIGVVNPGEESVSLTAHVADSKSDLATGIRWQLRNELRELVYDETADEFSKALPPGIYFVEASYGNAILREQFTLLEGNRLSISFALNAGALRVLPALKDIVTTEIGSRTLVFAMSGPDRGKLVAQSAVPGEVLTLRAGLYRVENRFGAGNTVAVTDVHVRPGLISGLEVTHLGGLARFSFAGTPSAKVNWEVKAQDGQGVASFEGQQQEIALKPGTYQAEAFVNGEVLTARFKISAGEERDILLGN
jgi:hypothetical protein